MKEATEYRVTFTEKDDAEYGELTVLINDEEANINGGYVTCTVNAGDTHIDFVVEESSSCNILVIILICAAVLIVIAVAAVIILKAKKTSKKSEDKPEEAKAE